MKMAAKKHGLNVERTCAKCKAVFVPQGEHAGRIAKYCSKACWSTRGAYRNTECRGCGKIGLGKWGKQYCSRACAHRQVEENAPAFKGDKASYSAIHKWVTANFGKPVVCLCCETKEARMHWANIDHKYRRARSDWVPLCASCHAYFDHGNPHYCDIVISRWEDFTGKTATRAENTDGG